MIYVSSKTGLVSRIDISDSSPVIEKTQVSTKEIRKMAISNYGYFACGDSNGELFMCDNPRLENIKSFYKIPESEIIRDVVFNPDGSCVGFTDSGGHLSILDIETKSIITKKAHNGHAICLSFSPNGNIVATGGQDEVIRLWRINEERLKDFSKSKVTATILQTWSLIVIRYYGQLVVMQKSKTGIYEALTENDFRIAF